MGQSGFGSSRVHFLLPSYQKVQDTSEDIEKNDQQDPYQLVITLKVTPDDVDQGNQRQQDSNGG
jgi:hypothetical protein